MNKIYNRLSAMTLIALLTLGLTGCQRDDYDCGDSQEKYYPVRLLMGISKQSQVDMPTRALPTDYSVYEPLSNPGKIGMFMTRNQEGVSSNTYTTVAGYFTWESASTWKSSVSVKYDKDATGTGNDYYAYGFMPAGAGIDAEITSTDFAASATMKLFNVPPISAQDICIVTGVKTGSPDTPLPADPKNYTYPSIENIDIIEGEYTYTADTLSNAIYLLLRHIYAKYTLKMKVDAQYDSLRTIKVKDMKLSASAPAITVTVGYAHGLAPTVSMAAQTETTTLESDVFNSETALDTTAIDLVSFYCANQLNSLMLETTFDVYDKHGNKLRSNCVTKNTVKVSTLEAGKHYTITATIKPTYLYQLSEDDLEQPMVEI